jgi:Flp pilus assembly pilin Flp
MKRLQGASILKNERGQGMAEYIIIVILVAIIVLVGIRLFGGSIINQFNNATNEIDTLQ